jgi:hypothetical protein
MALAEPSQTPDPSPRCAHCGAVIGVYEPATQMVGDQARMTSRAAEPSLSLDSPGRLYHASCYELVRAESAA